MAAIVPIVIDWLIEHGSYSAKIWLIFLDARLSCSLEQGCYSAKCCWLMDWLIDISRFQTVLRLEQGCYSANCYWLMDWLISRYQIVLQPWGWLLNAVDWLIDWFLNTTLSKAATVLKFVVDWLTDRLIDISRYKTVLQPSARLLQCSMLLIDWLIDWFLAIRLSCSLEQGCYSAKNLLIIWLIDFSLSDCPAALSTVLRKPFCPGFSTGKDMQIKIFFLFISLKLFLVFNLFLINWWKEKKEENGRKQFKNSHILIQRFNPPPPPFNTHKKRTFLHWCI